MPLIVEVWDELKSCWRELNQITPGDIPCSLSHFSITEGRQIVLYECAPDDTCSRINISLSGFDVESQGGLRGVGTVAGQTRRIAELKDGEAHVMMVFTDNMLVAHKIRFFHRKIDFGARVCPLCSQAIATQEFARHAEDHGPYEMANWPGGIPGYMKFLRDSLKESIRRSEGFPGVQEPLKYALETMNQFERRLNAGLN